MRDEPRKVVNLRGPKKEPEPVVVVAPELVDEINWPVQNGFTRKQIRWFRTLRGYLTLHLDRRDLIPPDIYKLTAEDKALPRRPEGYDRWHAHWMDRMLMRVLEGEDARTVFKLDQHFAGANTEQRDQNMALEVARLLRSPVVLIPPERSREQHVINQVVDRFAVSDKTVRLACKTWKVTHGQLTHWIRTLKDAHKL